MSKMSIIGLILGLLFLGALFFIIGFLAAVSTLESKEEEHSPHPTWHTSNSNLHHEESKGKKGGKLAGIVGKLIGKEASKALKGASSVIPKPLLPFARHGIKSAHSEIRHVGRQFNPFHPHGRGAMPDPQYNPEPQPYYGGYDPHQQGAPSQPYVAPYTQPYGPPSAQENYQHPPTFPQEGYPGYYAPTQPAQPPIAAAPQQIPPPTMIPQQNMMMQPAPSYPYPYPPPVPQQRGYP